MAYPIIFFVAFLKGLTALFPIFLTLIGLIILNGLLIGRIEGWRTGDTLYHAFINATTVGYGDLHPTKGAAKVLAIVNAFVGLLLTGVFVGVGVYAVEVTINLPLQE